MNKKLVQEQFGASAAQYASSKTHAQGESLARLVTLVQPQPHWQVLDVATGAGHTALAFAPHVARVIASDLTPQMLAQTAELARERGLPQVETRLADAEDLPFAAATFDLVTCRIAPHHFPDIPRFAAAAARVLQPGGVLAVVDNVVPAGEAGAFVNDFEKRRDPSHGRCLTLEEWLAAYAAAGLEIIHTELLTKEIPFYSWARRMMKDETAVEALRAQLLAAPAPALDFLRPAQADGDLVFHLQEGLLLGRKPAAG